MAASDQKAESMHDVLDDKQRPQFDQVNKIAINFAPISDLMKIPGVKVKLARTIIAVRESSGNITPEILAALMRRPLSNGVINFIDFEKNASLSENSDTSGADGEGEDEGGQDSFGEWSQGQGNDWGLRAELVDVIKAATSVIAQANANSPKVEPVSLEKPKVQLMSPGDFAVTQGDALTPSLSRPRKLQFKDNPSGVQRSARQQNDIIRSIPKALSYDGKSGWETFRMKFKRYARTAGWTESDCLDGLWWCLTGKAAEYYTLLWERNEHQSFASLFSKLEARFGDAELPQAAEAKFRQAYQQAEEQLEDWADRVLTLCTKAFRDLPEQYTQAQATNRFCQGLKDKDAGYHVCMQEPSSVHEAVQLVRKYQHVHIAVYGKTKRDVKRRSDETEAVYAVQAATPVKPPAQPEADFHKALKALEERLTKTIVSSKSRSTSKSQGGRSIKCYQCGEEGHIRRDCPKKNQYLNTNGAERQPTPRPNQQ